MAAVGLWGYRSGRSEVRKARIANTAVAAGIKVGDILKYDGVGDGYYTVAAAGDLPRCVALEPVPAANIPTADGGVEIAAEFSEDAVFEYPPDAGTVTVAALVNKTCDLGGVQSIDIDATVDDGVHIIDVDLNRNTVFCKFKFLLNLSGV